MTIKSESGNRGIMLMRAYFCRAEWERRLIALLGDVDYCILLLVDSLLGYRTQFDISEDWTHLKNAYRIFILWHFGK